jgi:hypothetical protein
MVMKRQIVVACALLLARGGFAGIAVDFENRDPGVYTEDMMADDFDGLNWSNGLDQQRARVTADGDGRVLRVAYPQGGVGAGTNGGGVQFKCALGAKTDSAYAEYRIKFGAGFDFVKGGKLPGLCGGQCNTGGDKCTGTDGWSARYMWRADGKAVVYLYDMMMREYGADIDLNHPDFFYFEPGVWYTIRQFIQMNDPDIRNGRIKVWIDGEEMLDYRYAKFRSTENLKINLLYFSTFFGGGTSSWAPTKDEHIFFDDIRAWDAAGASKAGAPRRLAGKSRPFELRKNMLRIRTGSGVRGASLYTCGGVLVWQAAGEGLLAGVRGLSRGSYVLHVETALGARAWPIVAAW